MDQMDYGAVLPPSLMVFFWGVGRQLFGILESDRYGLKDNFNQSLKCYLGPTLAI